MQTQKAGEVSLVTVTQICSDLSSLMNHVFSEPNRLRLRFNSFVCVMRIDRLAESAACNISVLDITDSVSLLQKGDACWFLTSD